MHKNVIVAVFALSSSVVNAGGVTLIHELNNNSEVTVRYLNESACILKYSDGDYLTRENSPVFYTFQVDLSDAKLHQGTLSWLPHGLDYDKPTNLVFHNGSDKKIYQYSVKASEYGELYYNTDLFSQFLNAEKIRIEQGNVIKEMPFYNKSKLPNSAKKSFQQCIQKLELALKNYCLSSEQTKKECAAADTDRKFVGLVIKDYPSVIAEREKIAAEKLALEEDNKREEEKLAEAKRLKEQRLSAAKKVDRPKVVATSKVVTPSTDIASQALPFNVETPASTVKDKYKVKDKKLLFIYSDEVEKPFKLKKYVQYDKISTSYVIDDERGRVMRVRHLTDKGIVYYENQNGGADYSEYEFLEFDLNLQSDPRDDGGFNVKMDCFFPCTSGNYAIENPELGQWKHYKIKLDDLVHNPGSSLNIGNVNTPFAISPDWGKQRGVVFLIDNIRLSN